MDVVSVLPEVDRNEKFTFPNQSGSGGGGGSGQGHGGASCARAAPHAVSHRSKIARISLFTRTSLIPTFRILAHPEAPQATHPPFRRTAKPLRPVSE